MIRSAWLMAVALLSGAWPTLAAPPAPLTLDELFPNKPLTGKQARAMAWSRDDRYLAYAWNAYDDKGWDLWLWDRRTGKSRRLTTIDTFVPFDRELPAIRERYQKDKEEQERRKKLSAEERKKLEDEDKKKEKERKEPLKEYPGVGAFVWAHGRDELLLTYKGDLYRLALDEKAAPVRLTKTRDSESAPRWSLDDSAFLFRRGDGLYRRSFGDGAEVQLNPELPAGLDLDRYAFSPDQTKLLIVTGKRSGPPPRQVSYLTYRDRFAQARTTDRDTGDDPDRNESYVFCYDIAADDGKPWEVYKKPDGEPGDIAVADEPFSADSKRFVLATWKRDKKELQVLVGDVANKKSRAVLTDTASGEHRSPGVADPIFSPDGNQIALLLEKSGWRQAWTINPAGEGATQLTRGDFETYPIQFAPDSKSLIVRSSKEDPSRMDLYRVAIPSGEMERLTADDGRHTGFALSHDTQRFASIRTSWQKLPELTVGGDEKIERELTHSHGPDAADRLMRIAPKRFTYTNRGGLAVQGYVMTPPGWKKDEKRPLLIYVYGGPLGEGKQVNDGSYDRFGTYCAETLGYVYAVIDPRGTSGYGAVFGKANFGQPGVPQTEDLSDGVKWLIANYNIDPAKVGIHGWSFGGFQTQMCLYTAPDVFTLGIAGAGPTEWQNYNNWYVGGVIDAGKKADELDKYSLTKLAKNLKAPLLLLHGMEDTNVLAQDTIKVYRELLKAEKGPLVELVLDPTGGHGLGGDIETKQRMQIYAGFLERHWGRYKP